MNSPETKLTPQQEMRQILDETVAHFRANPRGISGPYSGGQYRTKAGVCCAVGRYLPPEVIDQMTTEEQKFPIEQLPSQITDQIQTQNKLPIDFWCELQELHDASYNWNANQDDLTNSGYKQYFQIIRNFNL